MLSRSCLLLKSSKVRNNLIVVFRVLYGSVRRASSVKKLESYNGLL